MPVLLADAAQIGLAATEGYGVMDAASAAAPVVGPPQVHQAAMGAAAFGWR